MVTNETAESVRLDISIDPSDLMDGLVGDRLLDAIREAAESQWPQAKIQFQTLQIGHRQGNGWAHCWIDGRRDDEAARQLVNECVDWTDEALYGETEEA